MRLLGIGDYADLGDLYLRLMASGHEVRVWVSDPRSQDMFAGMIERVPDWRSELGWVRDAGLDAIILFEGANAGATQDALRVEGYNVIGGTPFCDRLHEHPSLGQPLLPHAGTPTPAA